MEPLRTFTLKVTMIPAGYMAKRVSPRPDWLASARIQDIYSVSSCVSDDFADYVDYWQHNGYWFFDSPEIIRQMCREHAIDLQGTQFFYYEVHDWEFDADRQQWQSFQPESSFITQVVTPAQKVLEGYDVVTFCVRTVAECSPLSCNALATEVATNQHCLLTSLEEAQNLLESGKFNNTEPGPYRIFAVYSVE